MLVLAYLFSAVVLVTARRKQGLCVLGKLDCPGDPAALTGTILKLYDKDRGNSDDLMAEGKPTVDGFFELCGTAADWFDSIDPVFKIYTRCNSNLETDCYRRMVTVIDQEYINKDFEFDNEIDLSQPYTGEDVRCYSGNAIRDYFKKIMG